MSADFPSSAEVAEISALCHAQLEAETKVQEAEVALKVAKEALRKIQENDLPLAMKSAGVSEIKLPTGEKVTLKNDVTTAIPAERKGEAFAWLNAHNLGDVIKREVAVQFGRGEEAQSAALLEYLGAQGWRTFKVLESVHPATLKSLVKEQLAQAVDIPLDLFGVFEYDKAIIKK